MKKAILHLIPVSLLLLAVQSCTEKIDVKLDETYTRLVVDGSIGSDTMAYSIILTETAGYFYNGPAPQVVNAEVTITEGGNTYLLHESDPGNSGIYLTGNDFHGTAGADYAVHIKLAESIAGVTDYHASCRMNAVTRLDSIQVVFNPDWGKKGFWEVRVFAQEPENERNYYLFQLYRNGTLLTDSISKYMTTDDTYFNGNYINGATAMYINNEDSLQTIHPGDHIVLKMSGITKEYYDFIYQVQMAGFNIPFFSSPPANVEGNIDNNGVGFFAAYSSTYAGIIVAE